MLRQKPTQDFAVKVTERSNHSFLLSICESRFSDICTTMKLKELNWLCKHEKNVRSSQPCTSMNFNTKFSKAEVFHVSTVKEPYSTQENVTASKTL